MRKRRQYRKLGEADLGHELDEKIRVMTEMADRDLEEVRVDLRWRRVQLNTVKRAAELLGIPYQTYIKQLVLKQALADIRDAEGVAGHTGQAAEGSGS